MFAEEVKDSQSQAHVTEQISHNQRLSLARKFVAKLKRGLSDGDSWLHSGKQKQKNLEAEGNILEEGEILLLQPLLMNRFRPDGLIASQISKGEVVLSLTDFADVLQLAIDVDTDGKKASGWYIKEERAFSLDMEKGEVVAPQGTFKISDKVLSQDGDIYVAAQELSRWFGFSADVDVPYQEITIDSDEMFPVQEKEERKNRKNNAYELSSPSLPLGGETYTKASIPVVDVTTRSTYSKQDNEEKGERDHRANIKTVGDFAGGTLTTQSLIDDTNHFSRARVTYEQDSLDGDLLGRFKAKHIEIGDIRTANTPIGGSVSQELGMRITNTDPTHNFTRASTAISGDAVPGWDVELYRHTQFLGIVHVGDDGFYSFDDITLFSDNTFRLVFYGPQGERHEETINVPFDRDLLSQDEGVYDISVSFDGQNTYVNEELKGSSRDRGSTKLVAMYEKPLADGLTGSVGFHSQTHDGRRSYVGSAGLSLMASESLVNLDAAIDNEGDGAAEFSVRRDFGNNELNYTSEWRGAEFDDDSKEGNFDADKFENTLTINGPLSIPFSNDALSARYNTSVVHEYDSGGDSRLSSMLGLNLGYNNMAFHGDIRHITGSELADDQIDSTVNFNIRKGANNFRLSGGYEILPNAEFDRFAASFSRDITDKLDVDLSVSKNIDQSLTDYNARLDWQAGFIRISPSLSYNSNEDFFAGVNTRFGLMREPTSGDIKMYDKTITQNAFVSAFVYLDKNGDGEFNKDDEPLSDVAVKAPQNGRRAVTNEKGIALFERMADLRLTDVFVDNESLPDPAWVPGFEGVSILPRQGYVARVEFPIHLSGEIDGTVYANVVPFPKGLPQEKMLESAVSQIEPASGVAPEKGDEEAFDAALENYQKGLEQEDDSSARSTPTVKTQIAKSQPVPLRNIELRLYDDKGEVEQKITTDVDGFYYFSSVPPGRYFLMISEESARRKNIIRPKPQPIEITYEGTMIYDHKIFVDTGAGDVPSEIVADLSEYKERHPHVLFNDQEYDLTLNLGEYNSRLLMSLVWYKLRMKYGKIFGEGMDPMVPPAESFANVKTGKHSLRLALGDMTLEDSYTMCRSIMARDQYCKVEIYPSYMNKERMKLAKAVMPFDATSSPTTLTDVLDDGLVEPEEGEIIEVSATEEEKALMEERIRQEEEEAIKALALDEELVRQIRARIDATAVGAATGKPISMAAPATMIIP